MNESAPTATTRNEYKMRGRKVLAIVMVAVIALVLTPVVVLHGDFRAALVPACIFAPLCACLMWWSLRSRLVLEGAKLTVVGMFGTRVLAPSEIEGIRTFSSRNGTYRALCLKGGGSAVTFSSFATDAAFRSWLEQFPDLDERDRKEALERISEDQELGATPEERMDALTHAKRFFTAVCVIAAVAAFGYNMALTPWRLWCFLVVALMPVLACFLLYRSPVLYALGKRRADPRVDLSILLLIAGFGLVIHGAGLNYVAVQLLFPDGAIVAVVLLVAFFKPAAASGQLGASLVTTCIFTLLCAWGIVTGANAASDPFPPQIFRVAVAGKHTTHGRSTSYYLTLEPWGPFTQLREMRVSRSFYNGTSGGDTVCVALHAGYLHAAWYEPMDCPASPVDAPMQ